MKVAQAHSIAFEIFTRLGVPHRQAWNLALQLARNEAQGFASHGLQRVTEYATQLLDEKLVPTAKPMVKWHKNHGAMVDGRKGLGQPMLQAAVGAAREIAKRSPFIVVSFQNGGHVGRLAPDIIPLVEDGIITRLWVTGHGRGRDVVPVGAAEGRFNPNPFAFGFRTPNRNVIFDMSTSASTEGAIRAMRDAGELVPEGLLQNRAGDYVFDPNLLYARGEPQQAFIPQVGGPVGYGLAVETETMGGNLTGAGVIGKAPNPFFGNSGLLVGFRWDILGRGRNEVEAWHEAMVDYLIATEPINPAKPVRLPTGERPQSDPFLVSDTTFDALMTMHHELMTQARSGGIVVARL